MSVIPSFTTNPRTIVFMEIEKRRLQLLLDSENARRDCLASVSRELGLPEIEAELAVVSHRAVELQHKAQMVTDRQFETEKIRLDSIMTGLDVLKESAMFAGNAELKKILLEVRSLYLIDKEAQP